MALALRPLAKTCLQSAAAVAARAPWPPYEEISKSIRTRPEILAEYGPTQHALCQTIYESGADPDKVVAAGKTIHTLGGFTALQAAHRVLSSVFHGVDPEQGPEAASELESVFEHVTGEWRR
jgi:hypothetical protein